MYLASGDYEWQMVGMAVIKRHIACVILFFLCAVLVHNAYCANLPN